MTPEERQMLSGLFDRVRSASTGPKDSEAESFINDAMRSAPSAGYALAQTVLVQQQALEAAAKRIQELDAQVKSGAAPHEEGSFLGNLGKSLFGGGAPAAPQPPRGYDRPPAPPPGYGAQQPGYAPQQPGYAQAPASPWAQAAAPASRGGGFLSGAMQTATGVAGGVLLGNALGGLLGGHGGGLFGGGGFGGGGFGGGGFGGGETVNETVNNYYEDPAGQHAQDVLQDQDQDQDAQQDAYDNSGGGGGGDDDFV